MGFCDTKTHTVNGSLRFEFRRTCHRSITSGKSVKPAVWNSGGNKNDAVQIEEAMRQVEFEGMSGWVSLVNGKV